MNAPRQAGSNAEPQPFDDQDDEPIAEWSLDELDHSADLGALRSADRFDDALDT